MIEEYIKSLTKSKIKSKPNMRRKENSSKTQVKPKVRQKKKEQNLTYILNRLEKKANSFISEKDKDSFFSEAFFETQNILQVVIENLEVRSAERKIISGFSIREAKMGSDKLSSKSQIIFPENLSRLELSESEVVKFLKKKSEILKDSTNFRVVFRGVRRLKFVKNSLGKSAFEDSTKLYIVVKVIFQKDGKIATARESIAGENLKDYENIEEIFNEVLVRAKKQLEGGVKVSGRVPVVIMSSAGGVFVHECIGHALEADHIFKGLSVFKDKLGQKIGSDIVTIVDDPTWAHQRGTHKFDDEGTPAIRNVLVENGYLKNYIIDLKHSFILNMPPTSSGKRESYQYPPIPRMTNTIILPVNGVKPEEVIRECWNGILIKKLDGGEVDTATGDFVFGIEEGYKIENGKIGDMIYKGVLMGKAQESLKRIVKLAEDIGFSPGTCGKDGQWVPVSDAQPTALFEELIIGTSD